MKKRLLSLGLALALLLTLLPVSALAVTTVSSVQVQIEWPYAYCFPQYDISCWNNDAYGVYSGEDGIWWHDQTSGEDYYQGDHKTFAAGHRYTLYIWLEAKDGYEFSYNGSKHNVTAKINGKTATVSKAYDQDNYKVIQLSYDFGLLKEGVRYVNLELPEFHAGDSMINYSSIVRDPSNVYAHIPYYVNTSENGSGFVNGVRWYDKTAGTYMTAGSRYQHGHSYRLSVALQVNPAYYGFWVDINGRFHGSASVNDDENVQVSSASSNPDTYLTLTYDYPDAVTTPITGLSVSGVTAPLGGELPVYSAIADSSMYHVKAFTSTNSETDTQKRHFVNGLRWASDGSASTPVGAVAPDEAFKAGTPYSVRVLLEANSNYYFDYGAISSHTLNGENAKVIAASYAVPGGVDDGRYVIVEYSFPAAEQQEIKTFAVTGVTPPKTGETPRYDLLETPEAGGRYSVYTTHNKPESGVYNGVQWTHGAAVMASDEQFQAGETYGVKVWVRTANGNYRFSESVSGSLNGSPGASVAVGGEGSWASITYYFLCNYELLETAEVEVTAPQGGVAPAFEAYLINNYDCSVRDYTDGGYIHGVAWYDQTDGRYLTEEDVFVKGHAYRVQVMMTPNTGYAFAVNGGMPAVLGYVNGMSATVSGADPAHEIILTYDFPEKCGGIRVSVVEAAVTAPRAGLEADRAPRLPDGAPYALEGVEWYDWTAGAVLAEGEPFQKGHVYEARLTLVADGDYEFDAAGDAPAVVADVNGANANASAVGGSSVKERICVSYVFPEAEPVYIPNVGLSVDLPVHGAEADFTDPSLSSAYALDQSVVDAAYHGGISWQDTTANEFLKPGDKIVGGHHYIYTAVLVPAAGYEFTDPLEQARINGADCWFTLEDGRVTASVEFDAPAIVIDQILSTVTEPAPGAAVSFKAAVPEGAGYQVTNVSWYDNTASVPMLKGDSFTAGHSYLLSIDLIADAGHEFLSKLKDDEYWPADELTALINGESAETWRIYEKDARTQISIERELLCKAVVDSVSAEVAVPTPGAAPASTAELPEGAPWTVSKLTWYDHAQNALASDAVFLADETYSVRIDLDAKSGTVFDAEYDEVLARFVPSDAMSGTVNSGAAGVSATGDADAREHLSLSCSFPPCGRTIVTFVSADGLRAPSVGESVLAYRSTCPVNLPADASWSYEDLPVCDTETETPLDYDAVFEAGQSVNVYVLLRANDGYAFPSEYDPIEGAYRVKTDAIAGELNGTGASVFSAEDRDGRFYVQLLCVYDVVQPEVAEVDVSGPETITDGEKIPFTVGIPAGAQYSVSDVNTQSFIHGVRWYDKTADRYASEGEAFTGGHSYRLDVWLAPVSGYEFQVVEVEGNEMQNVAFRYNGANAGFVDEIVGLNIRANGLVSVELDCAAVGTPAENYVSRAYETILGREADEAGLAHWAAELEGGASAGEIIREFFRSAEYAARGIDAAGTVQICYLAMLDRYPDEEGLANWTALLEDGYSTTKLVAEFVSSDEFQALCLSYGLNAGTITLSERDQNSNITRFVQRCYAYALEREADEAGLNEWCAHLLNKDLDPERVAFGFIFSDEAKAHGLDDAAFIEMLYRMMLDRAPDADVSNWVESLGSLTDAEVAWAIASGERTADEARDLARQKTYASFAASEEFANMCANFGF